MTGDAPRILTYAMRDLVWGIESEVAIITSLSWRIDEHVEALNALRREAVEHLGRLDRLVEEAEPDTTLRTWLEQAVEPQYPQVEERFPSRLYDIEGTS